MDSSYYELLMERALLEAKKGYDEGEVPVGAVIADTEGNIISCTHNQPIGLNDPTAHAEILAMRRAGEALRNYRLTGLTLFVTVEPCLMCIGAAIHSRISTLVFGANDPKGGAAGSLYNPAIDTRLNHRIEIISGVREKECGDLLRDFFKARRNL
ncbi:MAG: tRNA adenosine(34) deaminase TadA [Deltaproteobacteria bacterium]|nr:tRNA adenosine(34) deaminase TadA [Deltaproteobacteria bacterium]